MDLPNWVFILGIVLVNASLLLVICMLVFKTKEADLEIEREIFHKEQNTNEQNIQEPTENIKAMNDIYAAMAKAKKVSKVETFEQEQEENAIISFQELLKFKEEQEKVMSKEPEVEVEEKVVEVKEAPKHMAVEEPKRFTNTEVISPIFGRVSYEEELQNHELEKSLNMSPLKKEIKESEDFLQALKEFRKNL